MARREYDNPPMQLDSFFLVNNNNTSVTIYFKLYRIDGDVVTITNMFHSLENYENKLR